VKVSWLIRARDWRLFHVHRCLECGRKVCDDELGSWTDHRYHEFPELCSPYSYQTRRDGSRSHTLPHYWSSGPFCPACAARVECELMQLRELYQ
jgi:hypothetical protein